jgi:nitrogenase molybdenum-cofactor synthesis protein NifE
MVSTIDKLTTDGCATDDRHKVCRSRGGESCAFDGAMIVLQPIADTAHIVHGPIACCGNTWEGRGTLSSKDELHTMGFTTDLGEIDIVYGSEEKLLGSIVRTHEAVRPKAIFVYATCVSGLTGEDIDAVCKRAENKLGIRVIPVNAPGFVGPKNLGNRIAGEVLLEHVIGTTEPPVMTPADINLIGEYNIAGDLWFVEPLLAKAGIRILSKLTGDSTFEEITWAHRAKLNVVVCSRALINVAREMERRYGIPYIEVSFFGSTEIAKALRAINTNLNRLNSSSGLPGLNDIEALVRSEERRLKQLLKPYHHLRGKKAVLYTGGVKSWSFISALRDLGIEIAAIGTRKSTYEDEEKMRAILGPDAPLVEDVTPGNLLKLLKERNADMLIAGGRNQYLAIKEGYPFVDVNQERHTPYAGYPGLVNLAEQIANGLRFYSNSSESGTQSSEQGVRCSESGVRSREYEADSSRKKGVNSKLRTPNSELRINPLKHSPSIGAAMALQGIDRALPIIHGAQGCTFLGKVLLTKHFREPIALASSKLFVEDVVMGSEEKLARTIEGFVEKNRPALVGVLTTGLSEVKGDDVEAVVRSQESGVGSKAGKTRIIRIATPDYDGGLETGYARAVESIIGIAECGVRNAELPRTSPSPRGERIEARGQINILAGSHLTPADAGELREIVGSFGMRAILLPDLSALDGSRQGFSPLAAGGTTIEELNSMGSSVFTIALGTSMGPAARLLQQKFGIEYRVFDGCAGLAATDGLMELLGRIGNKPLPPRYERQRRVLVDAMRDAHFFFGGKKVCIALEPDLAAQTSKWIDEMRATVELAMIPTLSDAADRICAREVQIGDLFSITGEFDALIANSHAEGTAKRLNAPLYEMGFPVYKTIGYASKVTIGYRGTLAMIHELANLMMKKH